MLRAVMHGICWSFFYLFPLAALVALCFRFPPPMGGFMSGLAGARISVISVVFYGVHGGFPVVAMVGAICGLIGQRYSGADGNKQRWLTHGLILASDLIMICALAIFGPWKF